MKQLIASKLAPGKLVRISSQHMGSYPVAGMILTGELKYHRFDVLVGERVHALHYLIGTKDPLSPIWYITTGVDQDSVRCELLAWEGE